MLPLPAYPCYGLTFGLYWLNPSQVHKVGRSIYGDGALRTSTAVAQAVKRIAAQNRLILSGTPIQNNVLELWALFDFLMPGFLGTHAAFNARYGKALAASKASKTGSVEAQAAQLAMEGLHKQVSMSPMQWLMDSQAASQKMCFERALVVYIVGSSVTLPCAGLRTSAINRILPPGSALVIHAPYISF